jgi:sigma-E factor negative regulatory protein RseB
MEPARSAHFIAIGRIAIGLCLAGAAAAAETPQEWLTRMENALASRNYQGVFVHEHSGQTETLRIVHRVGEGAAVEERIISLDGSAREFIRRGGELICYLPDQRLVLVEQSQDSGLLLAELRRLDVAASGQYRISELPGTRISGRDAHVIAVEPRDQFRYGYRLWIDEKSAMPLKTQLRGGSGEVVEQIVFTELTLPRQVPDALLAAQTDATGFRWQRHMVASAAPVVDASQSGAWAASDLPPGFRMTVRATQTMPGSSTPVTHLVFSDGLASVSVFVEQGPAPAATAAGSAAQPDAKSGGDDMTRVGSSSAYSTTGKGYRVTAIGEVPPDTVRAIASSMLSNTPRPAPSAPSMSGGPGPAGGSRR